MASPITGRNGRFYVDVSSTANGSAQPVANLNSFSVNESSDRTEVTSFGDQTKVYIQGLRDAQGDFAGFWDPDGTLTQYVADGNARKFYIYPQSGAAHIGTYWFGTGVFDLTTSQTVNGAVEVSGSWAASTPVSYVQAS